MKLAELIPVTVTNESTGETIDDWMIPRELYVGTRRLARKTGEPWPNVIAGIIRKAIEQTRAERDFA